MTKRTAAAREGDTQSSGANTAGLKPWKPGQSGNPGGRPRLPEDFKAKGPEALKRLGELMGSADEAIALRAATEIANRIYGKPTQPIDIDTDATEREIERIAQAHGKSVEDVRKRAAQRGMGLVS